MRFAVAAVLLFACTATVPGEPGAAPSDDGDAPPPMLPVGTEATLGSAWTSVGFGVAYQQVNAGSAILIAYGGYTAKLAYSASWASELVDARLGAVGVGQIYAVQGPEDPGYDAKEIGNSKLRAHLATIDDGTSPIYVVAHSSGSYVADELFAQLERAGSTDVLARVGYADLDGGGGLTSTLVDTMRAATFASAHDPTLAQGYSENHSTAVALADDYAPHATSYLVSVPDTGCTSGAGWCMHDVLITHRPHLDYTYDLADDYTDFTNRAPTIEYLDSLIPTEP
jgi:hypothetical protein|nr:hypothetical protein [Kofleriaceae bacterium]